jgi:hypothetical protein
MKEMYITFNPFTDSYIYYETILGEKAIKNRKEFNLSGEYLTQRLSFIDKKRKSLLHLVDLPHEQLAELEAYFSVPKFTIRLK